MQVHRHLYPALILIMLLLIATCCNARSDSSTEQAAALPEPIIPGLALPEFPVAGGSGPAGHLAAATDNWQDGSAAWANSGEGVAATGTALSLDSTGLASAWAVYNWDGLSGMTPQQAVLDAVIDPGMQYWLLLSDYDAGRWEINGPFSAGPKFLLLNSAENYVSPGGSSYLALIVEGGNGLEISRVNLQLEAAGELLFEEPYEDADFTSRGWYDSPAFDLDVAEHAADSTQSARFHFNIGATKPDIGNGRILFPVTESVYVSFYVKYSDNWTGSDRPYHPHELYMLTNEEGQWAGPASTHLTAYIEHNEGIPLLAIQDAMNIDETQIGIDLTDVTEQRAVAGCNGNSDGTGNDDCYLSGESHRNGKQWRADAVYFADESGPYYKGEWHLIEAFFSLNSIHEGIGIEDGVVRYWYDGELLIDEQNVILRTGAHPGMRFNQLLIGPYIGDGSPVDQTMWLDNLTIATGRL